MSRQILYSSSSYAECRSCCLTGAMNDYELFSSESVNSEVVCAMRNVAAVVWLRSWTILSCLARSLWSLQISRNLVGKVEESVSRSAGYAQCRACDHVVGGTRNAEATEWYPDKCAFGFITSVASRHDIITILVSFLHVLRQDSSVCCQQFRLHRWAAPLAT